jgi:hypothetical protein
MSAPVVLRLKAADVDTREICVVDAVRWELERAMGRETELTRFLGQLYQVVLNDDALELVVEPA